MDRMETAKTLNVLALALLVAYVLFPSRWLLGATFLLLLGNAVEARAAAAAARLWMKFASLLGKINTRIFLSIIFYVVLTPVALAYRFFHREFADHFLRDRRESYFETMNKSYRKSDFEKLW